MVNFIRIFILFILITFSSICISLAQNDPWKSSEMMAPKELADLIKSPSAEQPVIFNMGPAGLIKGAIDIGEGKEQRNLTRLKTEALKFSKDKQMIIYCGCCPLDKCPNTRPAFSLLKKAGFKNVVLLNIEKNLKVNWIDLGYPMEVKR